MLQFLKPGKYYLDYGPIQMTIQAYKYHEPLEEEIIAAAAYAGELLEQLSRHLKLARIPAVQIQQVEGLPLILQRMIRAAGNCREPGLTSMAAVAGAFADEVADYLVRQGATRVIINNGGDLAIRIKDDSTVRVGLTSSIDVYASDYVLELDSQSGIGGIATSGLGGRGLTRGIASAVVALAADASTADACATVLGNSTFYPHPGIKQVPAEELDPQTDIPGQLVTVSVEGVDEKTYEKALQQGIAMAGEFVSRKLLVAAVVCTGGLTAVEPAGWKNKIMPVHQAK
ncbi:MAG TPA: UPF0280 family protein [Clostridia bacterium]|nr:UPF0280 family protein [Clostridia bacterium]